jgi:predicted dithiol-disulfide oxidoreductase (DUF899 family)
MGDAGEVFHTYSAYARGAELLSGAFNWLDLAPKGRNERTIMDWVRLHDEYGAQPTVACEEQRAECCGRDAAGP